MKAPKASEYRMMSDDQLILALRDHEKNTVSVAFSVGNRSPGNAERNSQVQAGDCEDQDRTA